jgi:hypothetical protein
MPHETGVPKKGDYKTSTKWIEAIGKWHKSAEKHKKGIARGSKGARADYGKGTEKESLKERKPMKEYEEVGGTKPSKRLLAAKIEKQEEAKKKAATAKRRGTAGIKGYGTPGRKG